MILGDPPNRIMPYLSSALRTDTLTLKYMYMSMADVHLVFCDLLARAEELQLLSAEQYRSKDSGHDTGRESIDDSFGFKVVLRFHITIRSDFRSIEVFICITLLNLHRVLARAHLFSAISC